jgi:threonine/homoserine/homoserine lactone efflux protein
VWEFATVAILVIVTPGPDTALTIRNTLLGGRSAGIAAALGVSTGQVIWALLTSVGIAALLAASEPAFAAVKLAGAAFLVYLGLKSLVAALRRNAPDPFEVRARRLVPLSSFRQGLVSNLGNPKMAAFFPSLLPQFVSGGDAAFWPLLALGLVFSLMTLVWLTAYAVAVARAGSVLRRPLVRRALDATLGVVLVALGVRVATAR